VSEDDRIAIARLETKMDQVQATLKTHSETLKTHSDLIQALNSWMSRMVGAMILGSAIVSYLVKIYA